MQSHCSCTLQLCFIISSVSFSFALLVVVLLLLLASSSWVQQQSKGHSRILPDTATQSSYSCKHIAIQRRAYVVRGDGTWWQMGGGGKAALQRKCQQMWSSRVQQCSIQRGVYRAGKAALPRKASLRVLHLCNCQQMCKADCGARTPA